MSLDYREIAAPPGLDRLITCVWFLTGRGDHYSPQPVVPDGRLELVVHLGDPFSRLDRDGSVHRQDRLLVAGQLTGPIHLVPGGWIDVVGVRLTPLGAHSILSIPLAQISNRVVSLREVHPRVALALEMAATRAAGQAERVRLIVNALAGFVQGPPDERMAAAQRSLLAGYRGSLRSLADTCGMSPRTLERRFKTEVGLGPKTFQQVVRFGRAFRMLSAEEGNWATVALKTGYYDQAHLIRDFHRFAGASPRTFFREDPVLAQAFSTENHGDPGA